MIGGFGDWRLTMVFVSALAAASGIGIWALLPHLPLPPKITLAQRVAPIRDSRVALTLLTGLVYQTGHFISYTYFTVVFDDVLNHNSLLIGAMLVLWGTSGMVANLIAGRLSDTIGNRKVIFGGLIALTLTMDCGCRLGRCCLGSSGAATASACRRRRAFCPCRSRTEYIGHLSRRYRCGGRRRAGNSGRRRPQPRLHRRDLHRRRACPGRACDATHRCGQSQAA
jgi:hypothetical protein